MAKFLPGHSYLWAEPITPIMLQDLKVAPVDLLEADLGSVTLKELRAVISQALTKPFGVHRLLWLRQATQADDVAQNTLLKLLEEPPTRLIVVLEAPSAERFLPTLRSRLHWTENSHSRPISDSAFPDASRAAVEAELRSCSDRSKLASLLAQEIRYRTDQMMTTPSAAGSAWIKLLEKSQLRLSQNCNLKLVIDSLVLHYPELSGT